MPRRLSWGRWTILVNNASGWVGDTFVPAATNRFGLAQSPVSAADHRSGVRGRRPRRGPADRRVRPPPRGPGRRLGPRSSGSTSGEANGFPEEISYGAAKAAQVNFTLSAATELARFGVTANVVHPPMTDTGWISQRTAAWAQSAGQPHRHAPPGGRRHRLPGLGRRRPRHGQRHPAALTEAAPGRTLQPASPEIRPHALGLRNTRRPDLDDSADPLLPGQSNLPKSRAHRDLIRYIISVTQRDPKRSGPPRATTDARSHQ